MKVLLSVIALLMTLAASAQSETDSIDTSAFDRYLDEIIIVAKKPGSVVKTDRKVYSPDQDLASKAASASEILNHIPSVEVDIDGNVSMRGNGNVYNTPRFSDRHNYGGMTKNRYICKKEENQNGKTIEIYSFFQGESRRGSAQGNGASGVAGQEIWHGALENYRMEERVA